MNLGQYYLMNDICDEILKKYRTKRDRIRNKKCEENLKISNVKTYLSERFNHGTNGKHSTGRERTKWEQKNK
jgi:hypothetical protein